MRAVLRFSTAALALLFVSAFAGLSPAQEKSVRPGINDSFKDGTAEQFVERFEKEGREVYDFRKQIVSACQIKPGMTIADVGAGTGLFTRLFAPLVGEEGTVFALDITPQFVRHIEMTCREANITNVKGIVCTPTSVELPDNLIDKAFICDTYHHFEFPYKTMRSVYRALRPGGEVILVEFHRKPGQSSEWILGHVRAGKDVFLEEIRLAGFKVAEEADFMKESYLVRFQKDERLTPTGHTADSLDAVRKLLEDETAVLIDVREDSEWEAGHLAAAMLVPLSSIMADLQDGQADAVVKQLPKDQVIYCHCLSGGRVLKAAKLLRPLGYDIRPLAHGYGDLKEAGFATAK